MLADHSLAEIGEVLGQGLRIVGKVPVRGAVDHDAFDAHAFQKALHDNGADGIDGVEHHPETGFADSLLIDRLEVDDGLDVLVGEVVLGDMSQIVNGSEVELTALRAVQDGLSLSRIKEFAFLVEKLEGVPLTGVVRCGEDDAAVRFRENDRHLRGGSGGVAGLDHVNAASYEGAADKLLHHLPAQAGVLSYHDLVPRAVCMRPAFAQLRTVCVSELDDIDGGEAFAGGAADGSADARDGFNE